MPIKPAFLANTLAKSATKINSTSAPSAQQATLYTTPPASTIIYPTASIP